MNRLGGEGYGAHFLKYLECDCTVMVLQWGYVIVAYGQLSLGIDLVAVRRGVAQDS